MSLLSNESLAGELGLGLTEVKKLNSGESDASNDVLAKMSLLARRTLVSKINGFIPASGLDETTFFIRLGITEENLESMDIEAIDRTARSARELCLKERTKRFRRHFDISGLKKIEFAAALRPDSPVDAGMMCRMLGGQQVIPDELLAKAQELFPLDEYQDING